MQGMVREQKCVVMTGLQKQFPGGCVGTTKVRPTASCSTGLAVVALAVVALAIVALRFFFAFVAIFFPALALHHGWRVLSLCCAGCGGWGGLNPD
jgi:hypothetical protein